MISIQSMLHTPAHYITLASVCLHSLRPGNLLWVIICLGSHQITLVRWAMSCLLSVRFSLHANIWKIRKHAKAECEIPDAHQIYYYYLSSIAIESSIYAQFARGHGACESEVVSNHFTWEFLQSSLAVVRHRKIYATQWSFPMRMCFAYAYLKIISHTVTGISVSAFGRKRNTCLLIMQHPVLGQHKLSISHGRRMKLKSCGRVVWHSCWCL